MATSNFRPMEKFPLVVAVGENDCETVVAEMEKVAESLNERQDFFKVSVKGGYYEGAQFLVSDEYGGLENWSEEDAQDEFGRSLAAARGDWAYAFGIVREGLMAAKREMGLDELAVDARFSNGETWYRRVG